jgi:diguanylate cyclase (GGDEF)-like protein
MSARPRTHTGDARQHNRLLLQLRRRLHGQYSLRGQMRSRIALVFVLAVVVVSLAAWINFSSLTRLDHQLRSEALRQHYQITLARLSKDWHDQAESFGRQLEFLRILSNSGAEARQQLTAFLTAAGTQIPFDTVLIYSGERLLYAYGHEAGESAVLRAVQGEANWYVSRHNQDIHRIERVPLWLGSDGQGRLVVLRGVNTALLTSLAAPQTSLRLSLSGVEVSTELRAAAGREGTTEVVIAWPGNSGGPRLHVGQEVVNPPSFARFARQPAIVLSILLILLWGVLGRWLAGISQRVESLGAACAEFPRKLMLNEDVQRLLDEARKPDELGEVSVALEGMMHAIIEKNRSANAHLETLEMLDEAVLEFDQSGRVVLCSGAWLRLSGQEMNDGDFLRFFHSEDRTLLADALEALLRNDKHHVSCRVRLVRGKDEDLWLECRLLAIPGGVRGILRDVTQSYLQEKRITHMALHDALTGLPNRVLFEDRLKIALRMAERGQRRVGVCFIDLDHFKHINDTLGHKVGDRLLIEFSAHVRATLRQGDTLGRWGGDEFVVLLQDMEDENAIREVAAKLTRLSHNPVRVDDQEFNVTFSMGVAVFPDNAIDQESMMSMADRAMFYAKAQGRNAVTFYSDMAGKGMGKKELYIQNRLVTAIKQGRIQTWFQPVVSASQHRVVGVEALARWHEDELGWVPPATFIPMAENLGLIRELGELVWMETLAAGRIWQAADHDLKLSVNISKRQLFMPFLTDKLLADVRQAGLSPAAIRLEITESVALLDVEYAAERLKELSAAGFKLSMDDFGTGYSSLSQLHDMPVDELKIDISFVRRIHQPQGARLVQAIVHMTEALGIETVAEGVEDAQTAEVLAAYGVDCLQGYHFARPMPRAEMDAWLAAQRG